MASSQLGAAWLINESWVIFSSSVTSWVGFRNNRFRRFTERWRFRDQEMSRNDQRTKHQLVHLVKRSESLRWILRKYGISVDNSEATKECKRCADLVREEQLRDIPSSLIGDSRRSKTEQLPDSSPEENQWETASISDNLSGQKTSSFTHLKTGALFALLFPMIAICTGCILVAFHGRVLRNSENSTANESGVHRHGSKRTRWKSVLSDPKEPHAATESDSWPDYTVSSGDDEALEEGYSKVERDYQRFLSECGMDEHGYWRGGTS